MNSKIIYGVVFFMAFLLTTAALIFMNGKYNNIFKIDFSPPGLNDSLKARADSLRADSLRIDSLKIAHKNDTTLSDRDEHTGADSSKISFPEVKKDEIAAKPATKEEPKQVSASKAKAEAEYNDWVKNTAALYDLMDSKKAAKIIQKLSDNEARDILYAMKKKKAAEILAELSPEVATRFTRKN